jgi:voltage-gated sodium channel
MVKRLFLNDTFLLIIISVNALIIFLQGFFSVNRSFIGRSLEITDHIFTVLFIVEAIIKLQHFGTKGYFKDAWNLFDFALVMIALPSLIMLVTPLDMVSLDFLLTLRILRVFKFFRVLKFIPNIENLLSGLFRAIQSSVLIVFAFLIFNFIFAILSFSFFSEIAPEHFSNPLLAFYSTFKIFTVEGWYEIPDLIAERTESISMAIFARIYFVLLLFGGGIFGLSLVNSIFVESMMSDNNDELLDKIHELNEKINQLIQSHGTKK